jgi:polyferredoxin
VLLVLAALSLFLFTAIAGRLWCGYACPQTVYTEIFLWIERAIEGDRVARMKLDHGPRSARKVGCKAAKHGAWIALSLWTGFTFVGYFTPIRDLLHRRATLAFGRWEGFWILFYGFATYGNAGWMREQVCKHMCPYARFQSAMFDSDTLVITYDAARGEPRGSRGRKAIRRRGAGGRASTATSACRCAPPGIDIRNGPAVRVHRLRRVHRRLRPGDGQDGLPARLIRYSTENALKQAGTGARSLRRVLRVRACWSTPRSSPPSPLAPARAVDARAGEVDVIRDRGGMAREVDDGRVENVYRLQS